MTTPLAQNHVEIEVQDFGPIVHAKIDLRPMTVFIGPSNTGKSYLAILLYALHRVFAGIGVSGILRFKALHWWDAERAQRQLPAGTVADIEHLVQAMGDVNPVGAGSSIVLPDGMVESIRTRFSDLGNGTGTEILRSFGVDKARTLVRKGEIDRARLVIRCGAATNPPFSEHLLEFSFRGAEFHAHIPDAISVPKHLITEVNLDSTLRYIRSHTDRGISDFDGFLYWDTIDWFIERIMPYLVGALHLPAFYLPADRTGMVHAHGAMVGAMLANVPMVGLQPYTRTPMLSGVASDFLRQLIALDQVPASPERTVSQQVGVHGAAAGIERNILHGTIGVERSELINYPHFTYHPDGWKEELPLMHASSMVSELAPVVLYLRHLVQPGNVLIIEEPESHLHPAAQVEFTRQLAKLVQAGYRVIITTHSEWILEELANVVQRSHLPPEELSTVSVSDAALTADQVGVWLFRQKTCPRDSEVVGSEVVHVPLGESGLYDSGFDDVAIALSNDGANIFNRIGRNG